MDTFTLKNGEKAITNGKIQGDYNIRINIGSNSISKMYMVQVLQECTIQNKRKHKKDKSIIRTDCELQIIYTEY